MGRRLAQPWGNMGQVIVPVAWWRPHSSLHMVEGTASRADVFITTQALYTEDSMKWAAVKGWKWIYLQESSVPHSFLSYCLCSRLRYDSYYSYSALQVSIWSDFLFDTELFRYVDCFVWHREYQAIPCFPSIFCVNFRLWTQQRVSCDIIHCAKNVNPHRYCMPRRLFPQAFQKVLRRSQDQVPHKQCIACCYKQQKSWKMQKSPIHGVLRLTTSRLWCIQGLLKWSSWTLTSTKVSSNAIWIPNSSYIIAGYVEFAAKEITTLTRIRLDHQQPTYTVLVVKLEYVATWYSGCILFEISFNVLENQQIDNSWL